MRKSLYSIFLIIQLLIYAQVVHTDQDVDSNPCDIGVDSLEELLPLLSNAQIDALLHDGELTHFYSRDDFIDLAPHKPFRKIIESNLTELEPTLGVEALFLLKLPQGTDQNPEFDVELFNTLTSISTMEGIEYFSASRNRMRLFFESSYVIDSPQNRNRLADPVFNSIPSEYSLLAFQKDLSFGKNVQEVYYRSDNGTVLMSMKNLTTMFYGIIPLIPPEQMVMELYILPLDDCLIFYGNVGVRVTVIPGVEKKSQNSFYNRIKALYAWFQREISSQAAR